MSHPGLEVVETPTAWVLSLTGEHDASTRDALHTQFEEILAHGTTVVVDLSAVTFMDSETLGELFAAFRRSRTDPGDEFVVVAPPGSSGRRLLDLVAFADLIPVFGTRDEALAALG